MTKKISTEETTVNFWNGIDNTEPNNCWNWKLRCDKNGYGIIRFDGRSVAAHRFSYMLAFGKIPDGMLVCHACDNPPCCNPAHLFLGTDADNARDRELKGRGRPCIGEENGRSKLTKNDVIDIRNKYSSGQYTQQEIADDFGVAVGHISLIVNMKVWKHAK